MRRQFIRIRRRGAKAGEKAIGHAPFPHTLSGQSDRVAQPAPELSVGANCVGVQGWRDCKQDPIRRSETPSVLACASIPLSRVAPQPVVGAVMASLSIRKIDDETVAHLRGRAARHGVSMEEEVRRILRQAVATPERLGDLAVRVFSPAYGGPELELPLRLEAAAY